MSVSTGTQGGQKRALDSPGAGVTDDCELPCMSAAATCAWVVSKSKGSYPLSLSNPSPLSLQ